MPHPLRPRPILALCALTFFGLASGCATHSCPESATSRIEVDVYRKAETERAAALARRVQRLETDLALAEEALVKAESGLRGQHSRADAVSSLAEARIKIERAAERAPWRAEEVADALTKLAEADRQIGEGHYGSALFFVYRAQRAAETIEAEADRMRGRSDVHYVRSARVNMRSGPSTVDPVLRVLEAGTPVFAEGERDDWLLVRASTGDIGWVHESLLRSR
jgi:hypothetical protein